MLAHSFEPAVAERDPLEAFAAVIAATPNTMSLHPDELVAFHAEMRDFLAKNDIAVTEDVILSAVERMPLPDVLALAEMLVVGGALELSAAMAEKLFAVAPNDLRVQDALFRYRTYVAAGEVSASPGRELASKHCNMAYRSFHTLPNGNVHLCCSVWMRHTVGNVYQQSVGEIWNSPEATAIRDAIRDGSYRYCAKASCSIITDQQLLPRPAETPPTPPLPGHLNLSYDQSCNLSCPSCRSDKIVAGGERLVQLRRVTDDVILPALRDADSIELSGAGDPFASKTLRKLLAALNKVDHPRLRIRLQTNGLLFTREAWPQFQGMAGMIDTVNVSIDATEPDTYRVLRRGGELADLLPNLEFIGELRRSGAITMFRMCFIAQDLNFRQMPAFVELARKVNASHVHFQMLNDWGTFCMSELNQKRVHLREHPDHEEFLAILREIHAIESPIIQSDFRALT